MKRLFIFSFVLFFALKTNAQSDSLLNIFQSPPESSKPWVFWYWMKAAVTCEGITADLEALKNNGIGGVYLVPVYGVTNPPLLNPTADQLSPEWWKLLRFAFEEANRLNLKIVMHASDGFATAGGPWITPELSMQKVVWTETRIRGGREFNDTLPKPYAYRNPQGLQNPGGFYKDIAILAFPITDKLGQSTQNIVPKVTTSNNSNASFLPTGKGKDTFKSENPCWIQYEFDKPFTCRAITIKTNGNTIQAHRFKIEVSNDGINFHFISQLVPPRHGWLDYEDDVTFSIEPVMALFFRFNYDKEGSEPGAEDLNNAKWKPGLKVKGIILSSKPGINQIEGKNGQVWRLGLPTTASMLPDSLCVPIDKIIDISGKLDNYGKLKWTIPAGDWTILRIGHTSTGRMNNTAGAAKGLECDKLNPLAVTLQYNHWFGEITKQIGPELTSKVLKSIHVDSWESGSQNWSPVFRDEFKKRRGYDLLKYLPIMAGIPISSADISERFLYDVRQTISELVAENFFGTISNLAHSNGYTFTAESVAPVMLCDGMLHYKFVDVPMGEFWLNSPSHDKPTDILDAISGGHIYGRKVIQAEAFTTVRMDWSEHPGMLKTLQDLNYALGINRLVFHVTALNPWLDRKPGMTLDGVGLYFQRDQTWWKPGKAWIDYTQRCQALLQTGKPVTDIAIFTGEENPRRALTPDRFVQTMPGIFGEERIESEKLRLTNLHVPTRNVSLGITVTTNMYDPSQWTDPLMGYSYDSFNSDALLHLATVKNGNIELPGGASYRLLSFPCQHQMLPDGKAISANVAAKVLSLVKSGATIMVCDKPNHTFGLFKAATNDKNVNLIADELWQGKAKKSESTKNWSLGKGRVIEGPFFDNSFEGVRIERDFIANDTANHSAREVAWTHRAGNGFDIYFISNQQNQERIISLSLRVKDRLPEIWNPVTGETQNANEWKIENNRTILPLKLVPNGSLFVILQHPTLDKSSYKGKNWDEFKSVQAIEGKWQVAFDHKVGGPVNPVIFDYLQDWSQSSDSSIRYYSGTAIYTKSFNWDVNTGKKDRVWINLGEIANIAEVKVNSISCGVIWTAPFRAEITKALRPGENQLTIEVTNTWANRLIGDQRLPEKDRITWTTAPFRLEGKPLLKAGLLGPINLAISH